MTGNRKLLVFFEEKNNVPENFDIVLPTFNEESLMLYELSCFHKLISKADKIVVNDFGALMRTDLSKIRLGRLINKEYRDRRYSEYDSSEYFTKFDVLVQDLKSKMSYRSDFIISTIGMIATNVTGFISFWILFRNFPSINGWDYYEMLFLYGFSLVSLTPVQCLFDNNWSLRMNVYRGDFIKYCFRPINLFFYYQSEVFDVKGLGQLALGI